MIIPRDIPLHKRAEFAMHYRLLCKGTNNLFLFSADHKIEHLDQDFHGPNILQEVHQPQHLFNIAKDAPIGGLATQLGLIARYGPQYPEITYIIKLNSKTPLIQQPEDPFSRILWSIDDVLAFKQSSGLTIAGIGITIYLGSIYEDMMLAQAAQAVFQAHQHGLVAIIWMYPRGSAIVDEKDPKLLAGAVGVAACLGADFVKIHAPDPTHDKTRSQLLKTIVEAAGNTRVIIAGGPFKEPAKLLETLQKDIEDSDIAGAALGRSIFQHSHKEALSLCQSIAQYIYSA